MHSSVVSAVSPSPHSQCSCHCLLVAAATIAAESFWEVRGTFDLMKMLALQVKCFEAQPSACTHTHILTHLHTRTHTYTLTWAAVAFAARKWKMLAPGATKKSYEWSRHIFLFVAVVVVSPLSSTLPYTPLSLSFTLLVVAVWLKRCPESRLKCIPKTFLFSSLYRLSPYVVSSLDSLVCLRSL